MKLLATAVLLLLTCSFAAAQQKKDWQKFTSDEGGFSVLLPEKPTPDTVSVYTPVGLRQSRTFSYSDEDTEDYLVSYSKFRDPRGTSDPDELLNQVQKGIMAGDEGILRSSIALSLDGYTGREVTIENSCGSLKTHRFYIVGDLLYQLSVEIKNTTARAERSERFLNSFKLVSRAR